MSNESSSFFSGYGTTGGGGFAPGQSVGGGRFILIQLLGQGGMGMVWLAKDGRLGQNVALKFLPPHVCADPVALDDMRRETVRSIALSHPNIIRIHDLHETGNEVFIAMEYVDGPNLSVLRIQQTQRVFSWVFVEPLLRQLCDALAYAHSERVIHRDLKPANMMLDARGRLKLADFGIAAIISESHSRVSLKKTTSGTPTYMSPQQMNGHMPSVTDDVYSLGATLYEFLTSRPPFFSGNITHQVLEVPATPIAERQRELEIANPTPPHIDTLVQACLAKDPARRPPSARAVADWIQSGGAIGTFPLPTPGEVAPDETAVPLEAESPAPPTDNSRKIWTRAAIACGVVLLLALAVLVFNKSGNNSTSAAGSNTKGSVPAGKTVELFNGTDLGGWREVFDPAWSIHGGVLRGRILSTTPSRSFLVWTNGTLPAEFELKFQFYPSDMAGNGNGGFLYFSDEPSNRDAPPPALGMILGNWPSRAGIMFARAPSNSSPRQNGIALPQAQWADCSIRVENDRATHTINGQVTAEWALGANRPTGKLLVLEVWVGTSSPRGLQDFGLRNLQLTSLAGN